MATPWKHALSGPVGPLVHLNRASGNTVAGVIVQSAPSKCWNTLPRDIVIKRHSYQRLLPAYLIGREEASIYNLCCPNGDSKKFKLSVKQK